LYRNIGAEKSGVNMRLNYRFITTNILVIGAGAAGLRAGIAAYQAGLDVVVVGRSPRRDAHTTMAAGGINAVFGNVDPEDSWEQHFADTYNEAYHISDPRMVEILVREAPDAVLELAEWGCRFNRTEDGKLDQRYFGAHKFRRTCYAGDYTGREILDTLDRQASLLNIPIIEKEYITRLLIDDGICFGGLAFNLDTGERVCYLADAVVLAGGGHTRVWRRSSSRRGENSGEGIALALLAGCSVADMEMVQFHPTGMVYPDEWAGTLVTEAVRGEGGILTNSEGERFMKRYDPERLELSTRDRVALAIYTEIIEDRKGPHGGVFLDISHRERSYLREKLPHIYRQFLEAQMVDISKNKMEVAPTAHYSMGGVVVTTETCQTEIPGLYAAGEVTSRLHGANRLGGNSLVETVIFGRRAGEAASDYAISLKAQPRSQTAIQSANESLDQLIKKGEELPRLLQRSLRDVMWEYCGVVRSEERLKKGLEKVAEIEKKSEDLDIQPGREGYRDLAIAIDLISSLKTAQATLLSALERRESRGAHQRFDFKDLDQNYRINIYVRQIESGELKLEKRQAPPVPDHLEEMATEMVEYDLKGRLLE
jgi:succinate dehydrogenase / fumarate reductase, flavoprotein subunit